MTPETPEKPADSPERDYRLEEEEQRLQEELRRIHALKQQREAGSFADFLEQDSNAATAQRLEGQNARFAADIPGITRSGTAPESAPAPQQPDANPVQELNASLSRGRENLAEGIVSGKVDADPADMEDSLLALLDSAETK